MNRKVAKDAKKGQGYAIHRDIEVSDNPSPKAVREHLGISVQDALEWKLENGKIVVYPARTSFLKYKNAIKTGKGDIAADIERSRVLRMEKHR